jgi:hypothetical protein
MCKISKNNQDVMSTPYPKTNCRKIILVITIVGGFNVLSFEDAK